MVSIFAAVIFFAWIGWAFKRRIAFLLAASFILMQFTLKTLAAVYLDIAGPVYAPEVSTEVGGFGNCTVFLVVFLFIPLFAIYQAVKPRRGLVPPLPEYKRTRGSLTCGDTIIGLVSIYTVLLYFDMFRRGEIPLSLGLDRFEYVGGPFHYVIINYMFLIAFPIGYVFARSRLVEGSWDFRCIWLMFLLFFYLLLTGHRFGGFYMAISYFGLPVSAVYYSRQQGWPIAPAAKSFGQLILQSRWTIGGIATLVATLIGGALINNLFFVRAYDQNVGVSEAVRQRLFVQPIHLYWLTWDRWRTGESFDVEHAIDFMFYNPLDPKRNTGIQYLMVQAMGENRTAYIFNGMGQDYAGGYPEILIELGGMSVGLGLAVASAVLAAYLYRTAIVAVSRGHFLTAVSAVYVGYGLNYLYAGGMLNFLTTWTYSVKIGFFIIAMIMDRMAERNGFRIVPWALFSRPAAFRRWRFTNNVVSS